MAKSILKIALCLSLALIFLAQTCNAQLSSIPKRVRNDIIIDENSDNDNTVRKLKATEFGRSSLRAVRQLEADLSMSMSMSMDLSMSIPVETMSPTTAPTDAPTDAPTVTPEDPEPIGCNGDHQCPADRPICHCKLFCRFCFFPPCGTCVDEEI
mmetsp:Transcript_31580/g.64153  ORF Transcript_31580/g.64153 Transcript_31580/m.64153 type:complete len:154 (-) Transcript_31580:213-674(-)